MALRKTDACCLLRSVCIILMSQGTARASFSRVAFLGNSAGMFGGGAVLGGSTGAGFVVTGGAMAGNRAGTGGGATALLASAFAMQSVLLVDNAADRGGGVHVATDFAPAAAACLAAASAGVQCASPLQDLNFRGCVHSLPALSCVRTLLSPCTHRLC
jgi:hypothetical protein